MKSLFITSFIIINLSIGYGQHRDFGKEYIEKWKEFYPSKALGRGMHSAIFQYENRSLTNIDQWLVFNKEMLASVLDEANPYVLKNNIDARLLKMQTKKEIDLWERENPHLNSVSLYTSLITRAIPPVLDSDFLDAEEKTRLIYERLAAIQQICTAAIGSLTSGTKNDVESSLSRLKRAENYFNETLPQLSKNWSLSENYKDIVNKSQLTAYSIATLIEHIEKVILPNSTTSSPILSKAAYTRALSLYTDTALTPKQLEEMALTEINW